MLSAVKKPFRVAPSPIRITLGNSMKRAPFVLISFMTDPAMKFRLKSPASVSAVETAVTINRAVVIILRIPGISCLTFSQISGGKQQWEYRQQSG